MNVMANILLACGASPAMIHAREEAAEFAAKASALTINIGTLTPAWIVAMTEAVEAATAAGKPWVFDPVAVGATGIRRRIGGDLLASRPVIVRGNASEILTLAAMGGDGKGVDSTDTVAAAQGAARVLCERTGGIVAVTGPQDYVTDGRREAHIANGDPIMPRVTALGCALSGVVAAFAATTDDPFDATVGALAFYGVAGEHAAAKAQGPGSFAVHFLDALAALDADTLNAGARIA
jgi:hydroxyethylthiazole kinase